MSQDKQKAFLDPAFLNFMVERGEGFSATLNALKSRFHLVTDVHALQEIVYRYQLLGDTDLGYQRAMEVRNSGEVFSIGRPELDVMDELMEVFPRHWPRELIHIASMRTNHVTAVICPPESGYGAVEGLEPLHPLTLTSARF